MEFFSRSSTYFNDLFKTWAILTSFWANLFSNFFRSYFLIRFRSQNVMDWKMLKGKNRFMNWFKLLRTYFFLFASLSVYISNYYNSFISYDCKILFHNETKNSLKSFCSHYKKVQLKWIHTVIVITFWEHFCNIFYANILTLVCPNNLLLCRIDWIDHHLKRNLFFPFVSFVCCATKE
jgi:hypothetical protein